MNLSLEAMKRDATVVPVLCAPSPSSGLWAIVLPAPQTDFHFQTDKSHLKARQLHQHAHLGQREPGQVTRPAETPSLKRPCALCPHLDRDRFLLIRVLDHPPHPQGAPRYFLHCLYSMTQGHPQSYLHLGGHGLGPVRESSSTGLSKRQRELDSKLSPWTSPRLLPSQPFPGSPHPSYAFPISAASSGEAGAA